MVSPIFCLFCGRNFIIRENCYCQVSPFHQVFYVADTYLEMSNNCSNCCSSTQYSVRTSMLWSFTHLRFNWVFPECRCQTVLTWVSAICVLSYRGQSVFVLVILTAFESRLVGVICHIMVQFHLLNNLHSLRWFWWKLYPVSFVNAGMIVLVCGSGADFPYSLSQAADSAREEYYEHYKPELDRRRAEKLAKEQKEKEVRLMTPIWESKGGIHRIVSEKGELTT